MRFEDLLSNIEEESKRICNFLKIPFSERMLSHHEYTKENFPGKINYGKSIVKNNREKWRLQLKNKMILRIEEVAFDTMKLFNYQCSKANSNKAISSFEKL